MPKEMNWLVETLESRQMLSAHHHSSKHRAAPLPAPGVVQPAAPSTKRRHTVAAPPAVFQVAGGIAGLWSGGQSAANSFEGAVSLSVFQNKAGECYAILTFNRPGGQVVQLQSQLVVHADGQFTMQVITAKMALKFTGTIFNHFSRTSSLPTMNGALQYWDKAGTYKSSFVISGQRNLPPG